MHLVTKDFFRTVSYYVFLFLAVDLLLVLKDLKCIISMFWGLEYTGVRRLDGVLFKYVDL